MLYRAERSPESFNRLGFFVLAPDEQIRAGVFKSKIERSSILNKVQRRVEAYEGKKEKWFKEWFLPTLDRLDIKCISWEEVLDYIKRKDPDSFNEFLDFYNKCLEYNRPAGLAGRH